MVVKKFSHKEGINYKETLVQKDNWNVIKVVRFGTHNGWKVHQIDVKSAFLKVDYYKDVYMT